jgi:hypothetical protein
MRAGNISAAEAVYCPDGGAQAKAFIAAVVSASPALLDAKGKPLQL